jgi:hypothetical protein
MVFKSIVVTADRLGRGKALPWHNSGRCLCLQLTREEAQLDFSRPAVELHNLVRGFAGWPGTLASLLLKHIDSGTGPKRSSWHTGNTCIFPLCCCMRGLYDSGACSCFASYKNGHQLSLRDRSRLWSLKSLSIEETQGKNLPGSIQVKAEGTSPVREKLNTFVVWDLTVQLNKTWYLQEQKGGSVNASTWLREWVLRGLHLTQAPHHRPDFVELLTMLVCVIEERKRKTMQAMKINPHIYWGKGATLVPGNVNLNVWCILESSTRYQSIFTSFVSGDTEQVEVKVVRTRTLDSDVGLYQSLQSSETSHAKELSNKSEGERQGWLVVWDAETGDMLVPCQGGRSVLRVCVVQPPTKKAIAARDFRNGLHGKNVYSLQSNDSPVSW